MIAKNLIPNRDRMNRILIILALMILISQIGSVFAEGCDISMQLPPKSELTEAIERCEKERSGGNPNSITDFVCPQGDFFIENHQPINHDTLPYLISVNLAFNKADITIKKYMLALQKNRDPDPIKWITTINSCRDSIKAVYDKICQFGTIETILNEPGTGDPVITSTTTYPQELCQNRANQKLQGWNYLANIIMSDSIGKNQKNSTDVWITEVKGAYGRVLSSWHNYQKILARAVSKMTGYIKQSN